MKKPMTQNSQYNNREDKGCCYLHRLHLEILTIMDEIHRLCSGNKIVYYLSYGSLLGAVRHKGFIPWDDDLDIVMPRADFNRFISIASSRLKEPFKLLWINTDKNHVRLFAKVYNNNTLFKEDGYDFLSYGIYVDIFPLDFSPSYSKFSEKKKREVMFLHNIIWHKIRNHTAIKYWPSRIIGSLLSNRSITQLTIRRSVEFSKHGKTHYVCFCTPYSVEKETIPVEWYGKGKLALFEDRHYIIPEQPEKILAHIYGDNYMLLPPENKRKTHYPRKVVFSDGSEINFSSPKEKVSYKDIF